MVTHMKTTIDIADALLDEARTVAEQERTTLRALIEEGLREALGRRSAQRKPFVLRDGSFHGNGLHPDIRPGDWDQMLSLIYEGRGG